VPRKAILTRVLPVFAVAAVLALSFFNAGKVQLNGKLVDCLGYGTGYGYTAGPPSVTSVSPSAGGIAGGTSVTITGQGFCNFVSAVSFGGTAATSFVENSDTSITATSPAHAAGLVDVTVTNAIATSATSAADHFTYTAFSRYFMWYDKASAGFVNDNIHVINTSTSTANIFVSVQGATTATVSLPAGATTYLNFPQGTIGGPVTVNSDVAVLASQRVEYNQSFNEVWSESGAQASLVSYTNWYDNASTGFTNDNIHIYNPGTATASVTVSLTGGPAGSTTPTPVTATLGPGLETYVNFPKGNIGGPVKILSDQPVLASQRVQYFGTFNEVWAQPATLAATTNFINWYDKASTGFVQDNVHLLNPGTTVANVRVAVPNAATLSAVVPAGGETYVHFPQGTIGGPIMVTSDVAILSSQRVQYNNSFNEVWAQNGAQSLAITHFSWLDKASTGFLNVNVHLLNTGTASVTVAVSMPNAATQNVTLAAGAETYVTFAFGTIGGPVTVTASAPILAAQRVEYYSTFNEIWSS
jgi:IPT/TIG domain